MADRLRFGLFLPPYHARNENPSLAIHRDLRLVEQLDWLGFDECWVGEHHSASFENIGAPEMFIATRRRAHPAHPAGHRRRLARLS